jgi:predicted nucleotidyltransferase
LNAFLTGSHIYGDPGPDSDIDLVIKTDYETFQKLIQLCDQYEGRKSIKFGDLSIICCTSDDEFAMWRLGTSGIERLSHRKNKPYNKSMAKKILDKLRDLIGIKDRSDSGGSFQHPTDNNPQEEDIPF